MRDLLSALALVALGMVLMGATGTGNDTRPALIQKGVKVTTIDRNNATQNPLVYKVVEVDGRWIRVQLLKKSGAKKGDPFWMLVDNLGAFVVD